LRFSQHYGLQKEQPELDFVDIDPGKDIPLFIDPYALSRRSDLWSLQCATAIRSFFDAAVQAIRAGNERYARLILNHLSEPNGNGSRGHAG
jgi:hypothetical protein